jgi:hypothetical protein
MSFLNPGAARAGAAAARLADEQAAQARETYGYGRREYNLGKPLMFQQYREASLAPAKIESAGSRAKTDVALGFQRAKEAAGNDLMAQGGSPADSGFQGRVLSTALNKAQAGAFAGDSARRAERQYRSSLAQSLMQRPLGLMQAGLQGVGMAAQIHQNDPRQGLFGVPGLSLARGGRIYAPMGGRLPYPDDARGEGIGRGAGMAVRDPNPPRDVAMMRGADGVAHDPALRGPDTGGALSGPGTETSDSIDARLSHGEYVNPAFVGEALGTPAQDAIVEVSRQAQMGEPMALSDLMKLMRVIASFRSTQQGAPKRTAGEAPQAQGAQGPMLPSPAAMVAARGGGTIVRRLGMAPPVRAAGGGLFDLARRGAGLFRNEPERLQTDYAADAPTSEQPIYADREAAMAQGADMARSARGPAPGPAEQPLPWWGNFQDVPYQGRGKTSLRNVAKMAAKIYAGVGARHGGGVGAGLQARRA